MVSPTLLTAAMALGVMTVAKTLPAPYKECLLFFVCVGALVGSAVMQQAQSARPDGPSPPAGWRFWGRRASAADGDNEGALAPPEVLELPTGAKGGAEETLGVVVVPGNPGIPHFYCKFGEQLRAALDATEASPSTIYVVGYPNFATAKDGATAREKQGVASIDDEAAQISATLSELELVHRRRGLVLFGHSIGGWIATQHLLDGSKEEAPSAGTGIAEEQFRNVPLLVLAMPYLEFDPRGKQAMLSALFGLPFFDDIAKALSLCALALPNSVKAFFAGFHGGDLHRDTVLRTFLSQAHHIPNVPLLARTELSRLDPQATQGGGMDELLPLLRRPQRPPILAMYTRGDMWAPIRHAEKLRATLERAAAEAPAALAQADEILDLSNADTSGCSAPPPHAFVLAQSDSKVMADLVADRIAKRVANALRS